MNIAASALAGVYVVWLVGYLVGEVGVADFGIWVSIGAILAPLAVLDAGLSLVIVRAAAQRAAGDGGAQEDAHAATSLYAMLAMLGLAGGLILGFVPEWLLQLPPDSATRARLVAWILAADFALILGTAPWGGVLRGTRRYRPMLLAAVGQAITGVTATVLLVDLWGLIGAAAAQLAAHAVGRLIHLIAVRRAEPWYVPVPGRPQAAFLWRVARFGAPLLVISVAAQLSFSTDVLVVAAISGTTAASWIALGSRLPALAVTLVHIGADVLFPIFVREAQHSVRPRETTIRLGIRLAAFSGSVVFVGMLLARQTILDLWLGTVDPLAANVFAIYCVTWAIHMPAHILALVMVAHARHGILAPLIFLEAIVNFALSVAFVSWIGPIGAAYGSLVAVSISNLVVIPLVAHTRLRVDLGSFAANALIGALPGAALAYGGYFLSHSGRLESLPALVLQVALTAFGGTLVAWLLARQDGTLLPHTSTDQ